MNISLIQYCLGLMFLVFTTSLVEAQNSFVDHDSVLPSYLNSDSLYVIENDSRSYLVYNPERDGKRLLINTGVNFGMSLMKFGVLWISPEDFSNWDKDAIRDKGWCRSWKDNVKAGPVNDDDCFLMNGIMHPWGGAMYYMSARGSGFRCWESFLYSSLLSTFMWEYGLEAFAEVPSWQDLIITPVVGSVLGEGFFVLKGKVVKNDRRVLNSRLLGTTSLILMDPINEITDLLGYKTKHKVQATSSFIPINTFGYNSQTVLGVQLKLQF